MRELLVVSLRFGWPIFAMLLGLSLYFILNPHISPDRKRHALFKICIGVLATIITSIAIANYKINFFRNAHLLPVSLFLITTVCFILAVYFQKASLILRASGLMLLLAVVLSAYGNYSFPQVEGGYGGHPSPLYLDYGALSLQQLADEGEKIIFGGIDQSKVTGSIGKGQCPTCHSFAKGGHNRRGPNLAGIVARAKERIELPPVVWTGFLRK